MPIDEIQVADVRLEFTWVGRTRQSKEPVLVFLHEGLGCIAMWRNFPEQLCHALDMPGFAYSRAGYGGSDGIELPRPITYQEDEAKVLVDNLNALKIERAIHIGHSDGGTIALIHAAIDKRDRVIGAVTMAAHVFNEVICIEGIREARVIWDTTDLREKLKRYHGDNVDNAFLGWNDTWQRDDYWHWNIEKYLQDISCPLLVMQGNDDHYGSEHQVDSIIKGVAGPAQKEMLDDCGHNPHLDQPEITISAIKHFLEVNGRGR